MSIGTTMSIELTTVCLYLFVFGFFFWSNPCDPCDPCEEPDNCVTFLRPEGDRVINQWTDKDGGTTNLWDSINEVTANDDTDYVKNSTIPMYTQIYYLTDGAEPPAQANHIIRVRWEWVDHGSTSNPGGIGFVVALSDVVGNLSPGGGFIIKNPIPSVWTTQSNTFTPNRVPDYTTLRIQILPTTSTPFGELFPELRVTWCELEVPC